MILRKHYPQSLNVETSTQTLSRGALYCLIRYLNPPAAT